ncbi:hypothetical protein HPB48_006795 [Haemaphysalis longicornis]|uniref:Phosphatidylinositol N-acetylglucosaminyltransferase subunit C n=1 Tax=Haemaphysalis longicornis TaxID=44386 RepID=A0A9J6FFT7_HAELO|nr:hypothetical protein HPB48_006795 [Haemaphysalis longicornis]
MARKTYRFTMSSSGKLCVLSSVWQFANLTPCSTVVEDLHRAAVFMAFGSSLAPIMATLTETISTDTVYVMAAGALLLHLACHDYSRGLSGPWEAIALNGALFGAVCLASRLSGVGPVMALSSLAVGLFLLAPLLASWVQGRWPQLHVTLTIAHQVLALVGCWQLSSSMAASLVCTLVVVGVILPGHFIYCHQYRQ